MPHDSSQPTPGRRLPKQIGPGTTTPADEADEPTDAAPGSAAPAPPPAARGADDAGPRVLMLGWEFPPHISGGLGTACYGLVRALSDAGTDVTFVLPRPPHMPDMPEATPAEASTPPSPAADGAAEPAGDVSPEERVEFVGEPDGMAGVTLAAVGEAATFGGFGTYDRPADRFAEDAPRQPVRRLPPELYKSPDARAAAEAASFDAPPVPSAPAARPTTPSAYEGDLFSAVDRYAELAERLARQKLDAGESFDVIHAHDWMTVPAALAVQAATGRPIVFHVHSTEHDRSADDPDPRIEDLERRGAAGADRVLAVSHFTKRQLVEHYGVEAGAVEVVHNAIDVDDPPPSEFESFRIGEQQKIVLFLGRITSQKGPEYFVQAAEKVLDIVPDAKFVMAGGGDKLGTTVELVARRGLGGSVFFTGFLRGGDVDAMFRRADLYVMPSVSEPFGIAPLEAMSHDVPVIVSRGSGVAEVLTHALKVDFWDVEDIADKIVAVLRHPPLAGTLRREGALEVRQMRWRDAAATVRKIYRDLAEPAADSSRSTST